METRSISEKTASDMAAFIITESHEFITNLLSYLPAKSLCSCARVCKTWYRISKRLLKNRHQMSWSCVNALEDNDDPMAAFEIDLDECLQTMWSVPRQAILFTEVFSCRESARINRSRSKMSRKGLNGIGDIMRSKLPENCSVLCIKTPGTVGTKRNLELLEESESEDGISCLLYPEIENVRIEQISLPASKCGSKLKEKSSHELLRLICGEASRDIKCVLLFGGTSPQNCQTVATALQEAFYKEFNRIPVIAGALVEKIETTEPVNIGGLVFSGSNIRAASVMLNESVSTKEEIREQLNSLKSLNLENGNTLGFMFACVGRGANYYDENNLESQVFRECFPNTPLFGLFGQGEIGFENLTLMEDFYKCTNLSLDSLPCIVHAYTTTVVLISIQ